MSCIIDKMERSGTDDGYDAGSDPIRSILYRHITITIVRNPNIVSMKATLVHTKGEGNVPRV